MSFLKKRARSFFYAACGVLEFFKKETNGQIQLLLALAVTIAGFYFKISAVEWCLQTLCIALVLSFEMINSAIEKYIDSNTTDIRPEIKYVKDVAAGAVLVAAILSLIIAVIIYLPKIDETGIDVF